MAMELLKYSKPKITTSRHTRRNDYSLKMNVFFYLKAEKVENFFYLLFRSVELNLADRFLIYAMVHKLSSVEHDM